MSKLDWELNNWAKVLYSYFLHSFHENPKLWIMKKTLFGLSFPNKKDKQIGRKKEKRETPQIAGLNWLPDKQMANL